MKVGIITYDYEHLKTEQIVNNLILDKRILEIKLFALPFLKRKERKVLFQHRPNQNMGTQTRNLRKLDKVSFQEWSGNEIISDKVDFFLIAGAGIIDINFAQGKPIVNAHPGIIPTSRGLDSFKWAILNGDQVGITLHFIDQEVDKGEVLFIEKTPIFYDDTIEDLARRHYELEIFILSRTLDVLDERVIPDAKEKLAKLRMPIETEKNLLKGFDKWKKSQLDI